MAKLPAGALAGWRAKFATVHLDVGGGAEAAAGLNRKDGHVPTRVICHQDELSAGVDAQMGGAGAGGGNGIDEGEPAIGTIDGIGADRAGAIPRRRGRLVGGVQVGLAGI